MKLTFLGTGAADWPLKREGETHRYLSSTLIDGCLLLDPGPCVFDAAEQEGFSLEGVTDILLTHSHGDHYSPETLARLAAAHPVRFYATREVAPLVPLAPGLDYIPITPFVPFRAGQYEVLPLPGNHSTALADETPVHYVLTDGEKTLFYGLDGAWFPNKTFRRMKKFAFDGMVLDCTSGDVPGEFRIFEHNTIPMLETMFASIRASFPEMLHPGCRLICDHMARTLHGSQEELEKRLAPLGMIAARDGLQIEL